MLLYELAYPNWADTNRVRWTYEYGPTKMGMDATTVTVSSVEPVGTDAIAIELTTPAEFEANPGQFVKLTVTVDDEPVSRFYTISSPAIEETFEITLTIDPAGELGPTLAELSVGDEIDVAGPFGDAAYAGESETLVLAGGPGVGPAVGIAERTIDDGGSAAIVYLDDEPIHEQRLGALSDAGVSVFVVSNGDALEDAIDSVAAELDPQVFVYGFAPFLDLATDGLTGAGLDADGAKVESFGPAPEE